MTGTNDDTIDTTHARHVTVVVNPERAEAADRVVEALRQAGTEVDVRSPDRPERMAGEIEAAVREGVDVVAAVGGDGTQTMAAGVLRGTGVALAPVPTGTVNLLAQLLGIGSIDDGIAAIRSGATDEFDVGLVDGEPFVLFASTGFDAEVIEDVDDGAKRFGVFGYFATALTRLRRLRPRRVSVVVDGVEVYSGRAVGVVVANVAERATAGFQLAPDAVPDDGRLDVVIARCDGPLRIARAGLALLRGRSPDPSDVRYEQGITIDVEWSGAVAAQRDGDPVGHHRRVHHGIADGRVRLCRNPAA